MKYKIFLSHSSADASWAKWIANYVGSIGVEVYLYEHDPKPGKSIAKKIQQAIQSSDTLVVLLTHNSQFSPYVQQEIGFAEARGKLIIPIVQQDIDPGSLAMLTGREYINFDLNNPNATLSNLHNYLHSLQLEKQKQTALSAIGGIILLALLFKKD